MMMFVCLIPARAGSKRIKNKNIKKINNKLLIEYTLEFAVNSRLFNHIIVSSDSKIIHNIIKKKYSKKIIFLSRPANLAMDNSTTESCVNHALNNFNFIKPNDYIFILEPTSPLRKLNTIKKAINIVKEYKPQSVISTFRNKSLPGIIKKNNQFKYLIRNQKRNSQKRNYVYFEVGVFWAISVKFFIRNNKIVSNQTKFVNVEYPEYIDINFNEDLKEVKKFLK